MGPMDIAEWLRGLGLEQYEPAFRANEIDARVLPSLTAEDLKDLGVTLVGHRRRLLDAIAALGSPLPNPPPHAGEGRVGGGSGAPAVDGDVLRSGRLDRTLGAPRPRGFARGHRCISP